jgi:uncharacterized protein YicC (UPF0701 family)
LIRSMTAYGKGDLSCGMKSDFWWKSNPSTTAIGILLSERPVIFRDLRKSLRGLIEKKIRRGRVEVFFQMESSQEAPPYALELNLPLVDAYLKIFGQLARSFRP